jgi:hypothetical protein
MPGRIFEDDPSIAGDERLLRRIPSTWMAWDELGGPTDAVRNYPGYGLAAFAAAHARSLQQAVARDPLPEEPAHGIVYGQKKRGGIGGKLRDGAIWVVSPTDRM